VFAHLTLPTQHVEETTRFLEHTLGYRRKSVPANSPVDARWLDIGHGQELHVFFVDGFTVSPFEAEFGRHVALFHPLDDFPAVRRRITDGGGELVEPLRSTPFERLFFREPINGYLFELIDGERHRQLLEERT
jgi:catechol 2,3-dioxygenase-like lactoylglutathione lyase family enzyme